MRISKLLLAAAAITALWAQTEQDFEKWMHSVRDETASLRKNIEAKNGSAAATDARELQEIFAKVHAFWKQKNVADAMKFAMAAEGGFKQVADAAAAGNFDAASAQLKEIQANCANCHNAHREKTADGFMIKY
jgi:hypothetical protein